MNIFIKPCDGCDAPTPCGYAQYKHYDYFNTVPEGHYYDCPDLAPSCSEPCGAGDTCCSNQSMSGYIYSDDFADEFINSWSPHAIIYAGSAIDNNGSVAGITFPIVSCESREIARLIQDEIVAVEIEGKKLKLPFTAQNTAIGGPYGLAGVSIKWYFTNTP